MPLPSWDELTGLQRQSNKAKWELIKAAIDELQPKKSTRKTKKTSEK